MSERSTEMRDSLLLSVACTAGMVVAQQSPLIGLPMTAVGASVLAYRGRLAAALAAIALGVAVAVGVAMTASELGVASLVYAVPAAVAVMILVLWLPARDTQVVAALSVGLLVAGAFASDTLAARLTGRSLVDAVRADAAASAKLLTDAVGSSSQDVSAQIELARSAILILWPGFYFQTALAAVVLVVVAVAWGARRAGVATRIPAMRDLDLSVHVLWGLFAALVLLAADRLAGGDVPLLRSVGLNLLYCTRALLFLQGLAVSSAVFSVAKMGRIKAAAFYLFLWFIDQFLLVVSFVGLVDFWANFRRIPRDGGTAPAPANEPPVSHPE